MYQNTDSKKQARYDAIVVGKAITEDNKGDKPAGYERPFILKMKERTLSGFFTSQPQQKYYSMKQLPGRRPLKELGEKTWA